MIMEGKLLSQVPPHELIAHGIAHVPEGRKIFDKLTVRENIEAILETRGLTKEFQGFVAVNGVEVGKGLVAFPVADESRAYLIRATAPGFEPLESSVPGSKLAGTRAIVLQIKTCGIPLVHGVRVLPW